MVKSDPSLDGLFQALADPTRRAILARLARGTSTVGELAEPFAMSLPAVSKHLLVLERAGLIDRRRAGRTIECVLRAERLKPASDWIGDYARFWSDRLDALEKVVKQRRRRQ